MITINTNINTAISELQNKVGLLLDTDRLLRTVAVTVVPVLRDRVHGQGLDAAGNQIGRYSPSYLKERQQSPYNRTPDPKIIFSLTRQMENDMKAIPTENGWGIGYSNPFNYEKAIANERRENKKVLTALTKEEDIMVEQIVIDYTNEIISQL